MISAILEDIRFMGGILPQTLSSGTTASTSATAIDMSEADGAFIVVRTKAKPGTLALTIKGSNAPTTAANMTAITGAALTNAQMPASGTSAIFIDRSNGDQPRYLGFSLAVTSSNAVDLQVFGVGNKRIPPPVTGFAAVVRVPS